MARRKAGRRLAAQARARRWDLVRKLGWRFPAAALGFLVVAAGFTALMGWIGGREWAFFMAGAMLGVLVTGTAYLFSYVDPVGARIQSGFDGEYNTAAELAKLRRHGWRTVHNLHLASGDIDHVAVGPGGVVVIETKSSSADWAFLDGHGVIDNWARQAHQSAFRARHLVKQLAGVEAATTPYLITWVPGQPDGPDALDRGVVRIRGSRLKNHLRGLPVVLDGDTVRRVAESLDTYGERLDEVVGLRTRRWPWRRSAGFSRPPTDS